MSSGVDAVEVMTAMLLSELRIAQPYQVAAHVRDGFGSEGVLRGYWMQDPWWHGQDVTRVELGARVAAAFGGES